MQLSRRLLKYQFALSKFNPQIDYYKALGLNNKASQDDIKKSFKKLAKMYHPDTQQGN